MVRVIAVVIGGECFDKGLPDRRSQTELPTVRVVYQNPCWLEESDRLQLYAEKKTRNKAFDCTGNVGGCIDIEGPGNVRFGLGRTLRVG
jgi:hypothetical protein